MALEDGWTTGKAAGRVPRIRGGGFSAPPTRRAPPPRPRTPRAAGNAYVSDIGKPLFQDVDLDSHLERFVLDAVDGELPDAEAALTPTPPPAAVVRAPSREAAPAQAHARLLPELDAEELSFADPADVEPDAEPERSRSGRAAHADVGSASSSLNTAVTAPEAAPRGGEELRNPLADAAELGAFLDDAFGDAPAPEAAPRPVQAEAASAPEPAPRAVQAEEAPVLAPILRAVEAEEAPAPELTARPVQAGEALAPKPPPRAEEAPAPESTPRYSQASQLTVEAAPPLPHPSVTSAVDFRRNLTKLRGQLERIPRPWWESAAAGALGLLLGLQASAVLSWLVG